MAAPRDVPAITKHILKLGRQIDASCSPEYVAVESRTECLPNRCFENVTTIVSRYGGSIQHGWNMRQKPHFAEGEFYAVWRCPDGRLIDVTPSVDGQAQILFLPDSNRVWEGEPVECERLQTRETPCYCGSGMPFRICHGLADD
jgi:hypothetical protein